MPARFIHSLEPDIYLLKFNLKEFKMNIYVAHGQGYLFFNGHGNVVLYKIPGYRPVHGSGIDKQIIQTFSQCFGQRTFATRWKAIDSDNNGLGRSTDSGHATK